MAAIKGRWLWNDEILVFPRYTEGLNINFTIGDGTKIHKIITTRFTESATLTGYYYDENSTEQSILLFNSSKGANPVGWQEDEYRDWNFGNIEQEFPDDFYNYLIQHATEVIMPDTTKKYQIQQKQEGGMLTLHPETEASVVTYDGTTSGIQATNVQEAIDKLDGLIEDITGGGVVTGVKGDKEQSYHQGEVSLGADDVGAVAANAPITAGTATKITYDAKGLVTAGAQLTATDIPDLGTTYVKQTEKGAASGVATLGTDSKIPVSQIPTLGYIPTTEKGTASGVATLGEDGRVPSSQLPSYVDDVIEGYYYNNQFYSDEAHQQQITPEEGKIYIDRSTNKTYRWGGTTYAPLDSGLALGETPGTAYEGNKGKRNADNIAAIIAGTQKVGRATSADTATEATHATSADSATEATHATSADSATTATTATNAGNVTTSINGKAITSIFETNGTTVKEATHAASANSATNATNATTAATATKLATARAITLTGDVTGTANFDGSAAATINASLANVGTAGTYSVVTTDTKGRVTAGGQILEVGTTGQQNPSATLAVGGIFFKEI